MPLSSRRQLLHGLAATGLTGCGLRHFPFNRGLGEPGQPSDLTIRYIGVGCCLLRWGDTAVLTDPFWSHIGLGRVLFGRLAPDMSQVEGHLPPLDTVQAILVGHGHYDHVLDLPWVAEQVHADAMILGSRSLKHQYASASIARPMLSVNDWLSTATHVGPWWTSPDKRVRILPIKSGHPAQYLGVHLYTKQFRQDATDAPTRVGHFQEGETLAWLVDFLAGDRVVHRVFVETTSKAPPSGLVPASVLAERQVDVAVVAMDTARMASRGRPTALDAMGPHTAMFVHWENFFRTKARPPREANKVDLTKLRKRLPDNEQIRYLFPSWDAEFKFASP
jgi:L-ascorbate metabolism protein UlaG (beta-lactamase superfamily)